MICKKEKWVTQKHHPKALIEQFFNQSLFFSPENITGIFSFSISIFSVHMHRHLSTMLTTPTAAMVKTAIVIYGFIHFLLLVNIGIPFDQKLFLTSIFCPKKKIIIYKKRKKCPDFLYQGKIYWLKL